MNILVIKDERISTVHLEFHVLGIYKNLYVNLGKIKIDIIFDCGHKLS